MSNRRYNDDHYNHPSSSFSSSLLEKIYRSFDDEDDHDVNISYRKSSKINAISCMETLKMHDYKRQNMLRYNTNNTNNHKINNLRRNSIKNFSSSSSSFSSTSTSSSESSSGFGVHSSTSKSESYSMSSKSKISKLKPIRTSSFDPQETRRKNYSDESPAKETSHGESNSLQKRALKLYTELKKVKQPISPGGKLASFINSLFINTTSAKKAKNSSRENLSTSLPSTASSYTRSCLSKTPSTERFDRRTVRFSPVNNECNLVKKESIDDELKVKIIEKSRRVEEVAKELLMKNYNHHGRKYNKNEDVINVINKSINTNAIRIIRGCENEDGDGEDDVSCCSSDLFELDNLVDIERKCNID